MKRIFLSIFSYIQIMFLLHIAYLCTVSKTIICGDLVEFPEMQGLQLVVKN